MVNFVCILLVYVYRFMVACRHSSCKVLGYASFVSKDVGQARPIFVSEIHSWAMPVSHPGPNYQQNLIDLNT